MKTSITKGLNSQEESDVKGSFKAALLFRKRLQKILEDKVDAAYRREVTLDAYDSPNWAYKQADKVGYSRAMLEVISLLDE